MTLIRLGLFGISTCGFFELLRQISKDRINVYFLPGLTIACQVTILFFAGILNFLPEISYLLYALGFMGIFGSIYKNRGIGSFKIYLNAGYIVLIAIMLIMAFYVNGKVFTRYDNFSHWALVVKKMLEVNRYPNFEDTLISFQEYPLGSSSYIYYFAKMISPAESVQMLAQIYILMASLLPLYAFARKRFIGISVVLLPFINLVFLYNIFVTDLLVDTLLPIVGISGFLFVLLHCKKKNTLNYCFAACFLTEMIEIKNSGIFFAILVITLMLRYIRKNKQVLAGALSIMFPFFVMLVWQKHCKYIFASAGVSKHAMTVENYKNVFGDKTREDILNISSSMLKYVFTYKDTWVMVGIIVLTGLLIWFLNRSVWSFYLKTTAVSAGLYVFYQLGMLAMYIFSMPTSEALRLASIDRYLKTILLAVFYLTMVSVIKFLADSETKRMSVWIMSIAIVISILGFQYMTKGSVRLAVQVKASSEKRDWVEKVRQEYEIPMYESYCMLIPRDDAGYGHFLLKYVFESEDISGVVVTDKESLDDITAKYIFIYDSKNEIIKEWIDENYPEQSGNEVIIRSEE